MNNTHGAKDTHGSGAGSTFSFPKIVFEEDKRVQGTANVDSTNGKGGEYKQPPDSSGTKYYVHSDIKQQNAMIHSGKTSQDGEKDHLAAAMSLTFSKDGTLIGHPTNEDAGLSRRYSSGKGSDEHEFFTKSVSINVREKTKKTDHDPIQYSTKILGGAQEVFNMTPSASHMESLTKIKVAIEKTASKKQPAEKVKENTPAARYLNRKFKLSGQDNMKKSQFTPKKGLKKKQISPTRNNANAGVQTMDRGVVKSKFSPMNQIQTSSRSPRGRKERRGVSNEDLHKESVMVYKSSNYLAEEMLRQSEMGSIRDQRNDSNLSNDYKMLAYGEYEDNQRAETVIKEDHESPRYKHMP